MTRVKARMLAVGGLAILGWTASHSDTHAGQLAVIAKGPVAACVQSKSGEDCRSALALRLKQLASTVARMTSAEIARETALADKRLSIHELCKTVDPWTKKHASSIDTVWVFIEKHYASRGDTLQGVIDTARASVARKQGIAANDVSEEMAMARAKYLYGKAKGWVPGTLVACKTKAGGWTLDKLRGGEIRKAQDKLPPLIDDVALFLERQITQRKSEDAVSAALAFLSILEDLPGGQLAD